MSYSVIPQPTFINIKNDTKAFRVSSFIKIVGEESTLVARDELMLFLNNALDVYPVGGEHEIHFLLTPGEAKKGSYRIKALKNRIMLEANSEEGLFYAVQTLKQLLFQADGYLCELEIYDEPEFELRGFMLDCGRYFFPKEDIFRFLDLMALYKLNEFHWHLSEDQGFRCQLDCAPLLTQIGSVRSHTNFNSIEHSGYYSKKDIKEIVAYAHSKYIKVIPEIDTPGHAVSMISAYPELSCFNRELSVATSWGIKHDVLCIGKESTFEFMFRLFDELIGMFPDKIIHIGGDEVPQTRWKLCPHCQNRIKSEGLTGEDELLPYYLDRIAAYLQKKGIEVRMWNDKKRERGVNSLVSRQIWNDLLSEQDVISEINAGKSFILSNSAAYYLDLPYGVVNLRKTYEFEPIYYRLDESARNSIKGIEACLWTEFVADIRKADYQSLPRLAAFSETAWTNKANKNYDAFLNKLTVHKSFLYLNGFIMTDTKKANPKSLRKLASALYWERRKLCWAGARNLIDNAIVKRKYKYMNSGS